MNITAGPQETLVNGMSCNRAAMRSGCTPLPFKRQVKLTSSGFGPDVVDKQIENEIEKLLSQSSRRVVFTIHGLDDEGWGPVSSNFLDNTLQSYLK